MPAAGGTDADVIRRSFEDPEAFGEIFDRHYTEIRRFCVSRVGADDGVDVASQVFTTAFRRRTDYRVDDYPDAKYWLYGIALRLIKTQYRRRGRRAKLTKALEAAAPTASPDPAPEIAERLAAPEELAQVRKALATLRPIHLQPLLLYVWEELSYEEIAATLDIPVGTVRSRIARARAKIRELMPPSGQSMGEDQIGRTTDDG